MAKKKKESSRLRRSRRRGIAAPPQTEAPPPWDWGDGHRLQEEPIMLIRKQPEGVDPQEDDEIEAAAASIIEKGGHVDIVDPTRDVTTTEAESLLQQAMASPNRSQSIRLTEQALDTFPDYADAYLFLARIEASTPQKAMVYIEQGLEAARSTLGEDAFTKHAGRFAHTYERRSYLRLKDMLVEMLLKLGRYEESVEHIEELLRLDPSDFAEIRHVAVHVYIQLELFEDASRLCHLFPNATTINYRYAKALIAFQQNGPGEEATNLLQAAIDHNPLVPPYLLGDERLPIVRPEKISGPRTKGEAVFYAFAYKDIWEKYPEALDWLRKVYEPSN